MGGALDEINYFLNERERLFWKQEIRRAINDGLELLDPGGKFANIPQKDINSIFHLDDPYLRCADMASICKDLRDVPWPSAEEADRASNYGRLHQLLEKHRRPDP